MMNTATTLIQWHTRTISGCISMSRWSAVMARTLPPSPCGGAPLVLEHDAAVGELLANAVGLREVLVLAGRLAGGDPLADPGLVHAGRRGAQELVRLALQDPQHRAQRLQLARGLGIPLEGGVGELVQLGNRFRGAEIVVHRLLEAPRVRLFPVNGRGGGRMIAQRGVEAGAGPLVGAWGVGAGVWRGARGRGR